jgi:adenylate cyclase
MAADAVLPQVRVGLATGEVVSRIGDLFGTPVNLASRLTALAAPGAVLTDTTTASALEGSAAFALAGQPPRSVAGLGRVTSSELRRAGDLSRSEPSARPPNP